MTLTKPTCIDPFIPPFLESLAPLNYASSTIKTYRQHLAALGRQMDSQNLSPANLTPAFADKMGSGILPVWKNGVRPRHLSRRFAEFLIAIGVAKPAPISPAEAAKLTLLSDLETYLSEQRALSPRTVAHATGFARRFLDHHFGTNPLDLASVRPRDIAAFVQHVVSGREGYRDKTVASHLRALFQFLFATGRTSTNLAPSVPKAAQRWDTRLPRHLSPDGVAAVLASVRDNPRRGARDYAMLLIMARLGLRSPEVVAILLDDLDWRAGELIVRGKGKRHDRLPITVEVGEALSRYVRDERPRTSCRHLFVSQRAPHKPFKNGEVLNDILKRALSQTGQTPSIPFVGSHLLRHSLATQLVNAGASLDEIGDVLRHRSRASTLVYARVDVERLRSLALPWPVAGGVA